MEGTENCYESSQTSTAEKFQVLSIWLWVFILFEGARDTAECCRVRFRFFVMQLCFEHLKEGHV
jgi:hypothetical protein